MCRNPAALALMSLSLLAGGCASQSHSSGGHDTGAELSQLQGTWDQQPEQGRDTTPNRQRVVKQVSGDTETVTTYGPGGEVVHAQTARFKLSRSGRVPVYTFYDRRITAGPEQGRNDAAPRSFVYRLRNDEFDEVWGLLPGQEDRELVIKRWRRATR